MFKLENVIRKNIQELKPYSTARHEYKGNATVFLDANENCYGSPLDVDLSRYPDPLQSELKAKLSKIKGVPEGNIFIGNGSDEAIDLIIRMCCEPGKDSILINPPTYGMYEVAAAINDVEVIKVNLSLTFDIKLIDIFDSVKENTKLIFICSPNNPTGNAISVDDIEVLLAEFKGIVVVDEAYINFSREVSAIKLLATYPNLVVLQTLSKAWGLAGLRLGLAYASKDIIDVYNKIKPPYNINQLSIEAGVEALANLQLVNQWTQSTVSQRDFLSKEIGKLSYVEYVYPSDANFILVKFKDAEKVYNYLLNNGIIVRNRSTNVLCENCLRLTIGTNQENKLLLNLLNELNNG